MERDGSRTRLVPFQYIALCSNPFIFISVCKRRCRLSQPVTAGVSQKSSTEGDGTGPRIAASATTGSAFPPTKSKRNGNHGHLSPTGAASAPAYHLPGRRPEAWEKRRPPRNCWHNHGQDWPPFCKVGTLVFMESAQFFQREPWAGLSELVMLPRPRRRKIFRRAVLPA